MAKDTKQHIRAVFQSMLDKQPMDELSVVAVAQACGINRNTFYYHYKNLGDLLDDMYANYNHPLLEETDTPWQDDISAIVRFMEGHKKRVKHVYYSSYRQHMQEELYRVARKITTKQLHAEAKVQGVPDIDVSEVAELTTIWLMGLCNRWVELDMKTKYLDQYNKTAALFVDTVPCVIRRLKEAGAR